MDGMETFLTVLSVVSTLCAIVFGYVAFNRNRKIDTRTESEKSASMFMELSYMKGMIDEVKRKMELQEERHVECSSQLAKVEASVEKAHGRVDILSASMLQDKKVDKPI